MSHIEENGEYQLLLDEIAQEFDDFEIIEKSNSKLMKTIDVLLRIITFNQMKTFMVSFATTMGNKIYVPSKWNSYSITVKWLLLSHERVHMQQAKKYGRFIFSFLYLLAPVPLLFAYFRMKFEQEAYEVTLKCQYEIFGSEALLNPEDKEWMIKHFTTGQYFWMWVYKPTIEKWYDKTVKRIIQENELFPDELEK
jgi:hypothetical protein